MKRTIELFRVTGYDSYKLVVYREAQDGVVATVPDSIKDGEITWKEEKVPWGEIIPGILEVGGPMLFEVGPQFAEILSNLDIKSKSHKHALELARIHGEHIHDVRKALNLFLDAKKENFWEGITMGSART